MSWTGGRSPFRGAGNLICYALREVLVAVPDIPNVIGDAPHLGVAAEFEGFIDRSGAGGEAEDDGPRNFAKREADHANFVRLVRMTGNAIDFEEVDAPVGVEFGDGIVIGLRGGGAGFEAVVVCVPRTSIGE